jgi:hypothetical protein
MPQFQDAQAKNRIARDEFGRRIASSATKNFKFDSVERAPHLHKLCAWSVV